MESREKQKKRGLDTVSLLHFIMCAFGGFLGGYAVLTRSGLLASAETGNLINIVLMIAGRDFSEFAVRVGALLIYAAGIILVIVITKTTQWDKRMFAILVNTAMALLQGFMPGDIDGMLAAYPIFFATAVQWSCFSGIWGYTAATIFCTNNLRQFVTSVVEYIWTREDKQAERIWVYGGTLLCFHLGVFAAGLLGRVLGLQAVWCALVLMVAAFLLVQADKGRIPLPAFVRGAE